MVTLITEQLQKQSLDDPKCRAFNLSLSVPDHSSTGVCWNPFKPENGSWSILNPSPKSDLHDSMGFSAVSHTTGYSFGTSSYSSSNNSGHSLQRFHVPSTSVTDLSAANQESSSTPPAPPTKRHCRSLSVPEDLSRCRSIWRPSGSKIWTPVKRRCNSGGGGSSCQHQGVQRPSSLRLQKVNSASLHSVKTSSPTFFSLALSPESPIPWTFSPSSGFGDYCSSGLPLHSDSEPCFFPFPPSFSSCSQRRFSLSPVHIQEAAHFLPPSASSTPSSTPELGRRAPGLLPRSQSQPCDLDHRKAGLKRRRDQEVRWSRPVLDFFKMNQTRNCTTPIYLEIERESCSDPRKLASCEDPFADLVTEDMCPEVLTTVQYCPSSGAIGTLSESEEEEESKNEAEEEQTIFQRDCTELDLNLIEEN